ncbi:unnamed protein product [Spodoptera littoralis]|uniref:Fatty acyl-CoA reductase n=1 Tax=Spodoptera littoralis TaxID=7109 RepID=A0A9P0IEN4_SPOLI|nr:unnamed protein product [Spodoptera littoralis]CAH1646453.1 unnamed protein product [Spodoptera littoralis]
MAVEIGRKFGIEVYIEKLLYSCPKLDKLYLLIREKKGISADKRITDLFDNPLFKRLKSSNPDFLKKVVLVPGDLSLPKLGISPSDEQTLINKTTALTEKKMEKSEFRVLIKHYFLRKKSITKTKAMIDKYYGDSAPFISMVKKWFTEFRCGRTSTEDAERSGGPVEVSTSEIAEKMHDMVLADRRLKVSIVYHAGATVRFHEPLPVSMNINFEGTRQMLELSQRMKNIEAFVFVSTAYAQGSAKVLVETTYPSPAKVEDVYKFIEEHGHDNDEVKKFIGSHFGTYAFAKSLSEAYIAKNHGKVPTVIIRPSAVTSMKDGPVKGWLDNWFGASGILFYVNEGAIRVMHGKGNNIIDFTPVDYVSNLSIISAMRAKESNEVQVFNSTSSSDNPVNWDTIYKKMKEEKTLSGKNKFPYLSLTYVNSKLGLQLGTFFLQITPAVIADLWLKLKGKDPKYLKVVSHAIAVRNAYEYFTSNIFVMRSDRTRELHSSLSLEDREEFQCDPTQIRWPEYLKDNMHGIYKYLKPPKMI